MKESWRRKERVRSSRREKKGTQPCSRQPAFIVRWQNGRDCEELKPKSKDKWVFVAKKREGKEHQTEWCATANKYLCMRCGRSSMYMKIKRNCAGPKW